MEYRFFGGKEVLSENLEVGFVNVTSVPLDVSGAVIPELSREPVPGNSRTVMVDEVIVIKQEEQRNWARLLDNYGTFPMIWSRLVLKVGSDQ